MFFLEAVDQSPGNESGNVINWVSNCRPLYARAASNPVRMLARAVAARIPHALHMHTVRLSAVAAIVPLGAGMVPVEEGGGGGVGRDWGLMGVVWAGVGD